MQEYQSRKRRNTEFLGRRIRRRIRLQRTGHLRADEKDHSKVRVTTRSLSGFGRDSEPDLSVNELFLARGFAAAQVRLKERRGCGSTPVQLRFSDRDTHTSPHGFGGCRSSCPSPPCKTLRAVTFLSYICRIYTTGFGHYGTLSCSADSSAPQMPYMRFLFVRPRVCLRLTSDSASRRIPLPSANTSYCQAYSGLSPPSYCPFQANQKTTPISVELIWEWFSLQVLLFNLISTKIFSIIKNDNLVNAVNNNLIFL